MRHRGGGDAASTRNSKGHVHGVYQRGHNEKLRREAPSWSVHQIFCYRQFTMRVLDVEFMVHPRQAGWSMAESMVDSVTILMAELTANMGLKGS